MFLPEITNWLGNNQHTILNTLQTISGLGLATTFITTSKDYFLTNIITIDTGKGYTRPIKGGETEPIDHFTEVLIPTGATVIVEIGNNEHTVANIKVADFGKSEINPNLGITMLSWARRFDLKRKPFAVISEPLPGDCTNTIVFDGQKPMCTVSKEVGE